MDFDGFLAPDFTLPLDLEAQKRFVQPGATVKGMQLQALLDEQQRQGHTPVGRYIAFRDYAGEELLDRLVETARKCHPTVPLREGLRRVGRVAYPALARSIVGKVVFAVVGTDPNEFVKLVSRGYSLSASTGRAEVLTRGERFAILRLSDVYSFIDSWHVGIFEGAFEAIAASCTVRMRLHSPTSGDVLLRW